MPRTNRIPKHESFSFRVDSDLKTAFQRAVAAKDDSAAQVLRDFMRSYVERRKRYSGSEEHWRSVAVIAAAAASPGSDESEVMRWIEDVMDRSGWTA